MSLFEELIEKAQLGEASDKALMETVITNYLSTILYSDIESEIDDILNERTKLQDDPKLASFLRTTFSRGQGRLKKSDVADIAKRFGEECKANFNDCLDDQYVTYYSNILECRHQLSHGTPRSETISTAKNGLYAAEKMLIELKRAISK